MRLPGPVSDPQGSPRSFPRTFDVVLKVAERCNLACPYCYYYEQAFDNRAAPPFLRADVLERLPTFLAEAAAELDIDVFHVILHGGEPLLCKRSQLDAVCGDLRDRLTGLAQVEFSLQTNGVLIDDEWIALFARHRIAVGVTIDGDRETHDRLRPDRKQRGTYARAVAGLRLLQAAVADGRLRAAGVLSFVERTQPGRELLDHLLDTLAERSPGLNLPKAGWDDPETIAWNAEIEPRRDLVRAWLARIAEGQFANIAVFADILLAFVSDDYAARLDEIQARRHHVVTISSAGALFIDDTMLGLDPRLSATPPTVFDTTLNGFLRSPPWRELDEAAQMIPEKCGNCTWYRTCRSGSLVNRFSRAEGFARHSVLCETLQMIHEEIAEFVIDHGIVPVEDLIGRLRSGATGAPPRIESRDRHARRTPAPA